jgi:hypothetical protein
MNESNYPRIAALLGGALVVVLIAIVLASGMLFPPAGEEASPSPTMAGQQASASAPASEPLSSPTAAASELHGGSPSVPASEEPLPTTGPTTSPLPSATPAGPSATSAAVGWTRLDGFPQPRQNVASVTAGGPGFVAVATATVAGTDCPRGQVWTSADGRSWSSQASFGGAAMSAVVQLGLELYAFGFVAPWDCPAADDFGNNVWRSSDGQTWTQLPQPRDFPFDIVRDVTVAGDNMVIVGQRGEAGDDPNDVVASVWTSRDGIDWQPAAAPPQTSELHSAAALGTTVVGLGSSASWPLAWYSDDGGRNWQQARFPTGYLIRSIDVVATANRFVAVAEACCGRPMTSVGISFTSTDGRTWTASADPLRRATDRATALAGGVLALGEESRLSRDGASWSAGPPLPGFDRDTMLLASVAAGPTGVVAVSTGGAWFAPLDAFAPERWTEQPRPAAATTLGTGYEYRLYTHCGPAGAQVYFAGAAWLADPASTVDGGWPAGFRDPEDRGTLTQQSADSARYRSDQGGSVTFVRTDNPPPAPFCA